MKSYLVPIYIKIGKFNDEKLLAGLFMFNTEKVWFHYSSKRIQLISGISGNALSELTKTVFDHITSKVNATNAEMAKADNSAFKSDTIFNLEYFQYLKKYGQNALLIGEIQPMSVNITDAVFKEYCNNLLNEKPVEAKIHKHSFHAKIKSLFKEVPALEQKADIGLKITPAQLPGLNADVTVALIAKNGCVLAADTIDFSSSVIAIGNTLNAFDVLVYSLHKYSDANKLKKGKYHLLINEPIPGSMQEKTFNTIYNSKKDLYHINHEDKAKELVHEIESKEYSKFSLALAI